MVNLTIDGKPVRVPKGTNIINAAKAAGIDVPFYCYHPHLSIAGNCRICQVEIKGQPKLAIACNTPVAEGMEVLTQQTSTKAQDSQAAVLEFMLINHPLDCTVCDQAGHCKLQDYHYEYNARPSRFLEEKVHKVKAEPLGPTVVLDGERCIMCTRCIRFCDEVTKTSELGMLNRGDRSVIAINPGRVLDNPLSGTVVDLCPVGALTHRHWRFNTRIWFTKESNTICPGCSTGCNARVAVRDGEVVQVKARLNDAVNKEWMCDEGRYGFQRFLPAQRVTAPTLHGKPVGYDEAFSALRGISDDQETLVFVSNELLLEEFAVLKSFLDAVVKRYRVVTSYRERTLSEVERILISPDYAPNFRGAEWAGVVGGDLEAHYDQALRDLRSGSVQQVLVIGDRGVLPADVDASLLEGVRKAALSAAILTDAQAPLAAAVQVVLPGRSVLEKSGLLINRARRLQYAERAIDYPDGAEADWSLLVRWASKNGVQLTDAQSDRELTLNYLANEPRLLGLRIATIKRGGIPLDTFRPGEVESQSLADARSLG